MPKSTNTVKGLFWRAFPSRIGNLGKATLPSPSPLSVSADCRGLQADSLPPAAKIIKENKKTRDKTKIKNTNYKIVGSL